MRAQILLQGVVVRDRKIVDPREFMKKECSWPTEVIDSMNRPIDDRTVEEMLNHFEELDGSFRDAATEDDEGHS